MRLNNWLFVVFVACWLTQVSEILPQQAVMVLLLAQGIITGQLIGFIRGRRSAAINGNVHGGVSVPAGGSLTVVGNVYGNDKKVF